MILTVSQVHEIERHARETYPEECCGFLLGPSGDPARVSAIRRATNVAGADRNRRYVIDPREILSVEKEIGGTGIEILGFYHSHPDHPSMPSEFDRGHAWPWYAYVIVGVSPGGLGDLRAWTLDGETRTFRPISLERV